MRSKNFSCFLFGEGDGGVGFHVIDNQSEFL
jgi:hypothetical protein